MESEVDKQALHSAPVTETRKGGVELIEELAPEWRELCEEGLYDEPFYRPEWIGAYVRAFAPKAMLLVTTVRVNGRLRGVLALMAERTTFYGLPVNKLRSPANSHCPRFDLVHGAGSHCAAVVLEVWASLKNTPGWDVLEVQDVPQGGALERLLLAAKLDGYPTGQWESMRSPYITLPGPGANMETVLARTDGKFRYNLRRGMRRLEAKGAVRLVRIDRADPAMLEHFYKLERSGWKGKEGSAIACDTNTRQFYDSVAREAERFGYLSLYLLECNGSPVAMHFGLTHRGRYFLPKPAYEESYKDCSPGHLLVHEVLRDCVERGLVEFDFVGPWMDWKGEWASEVRPHAWCYVFNKGFFGHALHALKFRFGPAVKRRLFKK